jgi:hypothetical protein
MTRGTEGKRALNETMDGVCTEGDVGVLVPDGITVLLDHDVSHPKYKPMANRPNGSAYLSKEHVGRETTLGRIGVYRDVSQCHKDG